MRRVVSLLLLILSATLVTACLNNPPADQQRTREVAKKAECTPDYVRLKTLDNSNQLSDSQAKEICKSMCFDKYRLTSYKVEVTTTKIPIVEKPVKHYTCYCDASDCGGSVVVSRKAD